MQERRFFHETIPTLHNLKKVFSNLNYKGINLWPTMAHPCYCYLYDHGMGRFLFKILRMLKFIFFKEKFEVKGEKNGKILVSFLIDRKDHHIMWEKSISGFDKKDLIIIDAFKEGKRDFKNINSRFSFDFPHLYKLF